MSDAPLAQTPTASVAMTGPAGESARGTGVAAIWVRELRGRMRGKRAFIFLTFYLGLIGTILWLALRTVTENAFLTVTDSMNIGRGIFTAVLLIETLVVVALAPAYTASAITSEREKQTYDLLAVTPISSLSLVVGKLLSGISYLGLIVLASLPIACLSFLFGGVDWIDLVRGYIVVVTAGLAVGAIGIWCSAAMSRTQTATVAAFIVTAAMVVGLSAAWVGLDARLSEMGSNERPPQALLLFNPFIAQLDVICQVTGDGCIAQEAVRSRDAFFNGGPVMIDGVSGPVDLGMAPVVQEVRPGGDFWPVAAVLYVLIAGLAIFGASQSISPTRRWRFLPRRDAATAADPAEATPDE